MGYGKEPVLSKNVLPVEQSAVHKKHGIAPVDTFLAINASVKNGKTTFILDVTTRYLVSGVYLDKVVETAQARALAKQVVR